MSTTAKQVVDGTVNRAKPLGVPGGFEAAHVSFSLPRRLMRDFCAVVLSAPLAMGNTGDDVPACCPIAGEHIGHQLTWDILQSFQQLAKEACGGVFVPSLLHEDIQDLAILIDRTPQIVARAINRDKHFVEMPGVAPSPLALPKRLRDSLSELQTPLAHGFVTHRYPALSE